MNALTGYEEQILILTSLLIGFGTLCVIFMICYIWYLMQKSIKFVLFVIGLTISALVYMVLKVNGW